VETGRVVDVIAEEAGFGQLLAEQTEAGAPAEANRTGVGPQLAGQDAQQRGLAGSVRADEGDFFAFEKTEIEIREDGTGEAVEFDRETVDLKQGEPPGSEQKAATRPSEEGRGAEGRAGLSGGRSSHPARAGRTDCTEATRGIGTFGRTSG